MMVVPTITYLSLQPRYSSSMATIRGNEMKGVFACLLVLCAVRMTAQGLPDAPQRLDRTEWALLATDAAVRGLDVYSTHWAMKAGNKDVLPSWIANHPPVMALYSGGIVAGQYYMARKLFPRHRKLAHLITAVDISITAPFAVHNLFLPVCVAPNIYTAQGCQAP
jgi:hypothetical protein